MQALEALRKLRTEKMAEVKEFKLRLDHLRTHKDTAARLRKDIDGGERQEAELSATISDIDGKLAEITQVRGRVLWLSSCNAEDVSQERPHLWCNQGVWLPSQGMHEFMVE